MIQTRNLTRIYRSNTVETVALSDVTLDILAGDFVAIMGPSGCGKSTLLNILGMLDSPSLGSYFFLGENVSERTPRQRDLLRRGNVGFVFQNFNLIDSLSVADNVALPLDYLRIRGEERAERIQKALEVVGIAHRSTHRPGQLSGGQQQRVAIARAIVADPKVILADEPTGNLDSERSEAILQILTELNAAGTTIVMVTHSPMDAESAHRVVHMLDGSVVADTRTAANRASRSATVPAGA